jgi:hypothetical protein
MRLYSKPWCDEALNITFEIRIAHEAMQFVLVLGGRRT